MTPTLYLDANATTHVLPAAIAAAIRMMEAQFGNPSSSHSHGMAAKAVLDQARQTAAAVMGAGDGDVVFTSGATESIQTAVLSALCAVWKRRAAGHATEHLLIYGATEHKAVPQALAHWNQLLRLGLELRALPVNALGQHDLQTLSGWLPQAAMVCTMAANNETGVVSDIAGIDQLLDAQPQRPLWLVDCVQALGKLSLNLQATGIDYAAFSGHKLYAPKGIGMLYVRQGAPFTPLMAGGGQEGGLRSGTENMPGIAAFGAVLMALQQGQTFATHVQLCDYRDQLATSLRNAFPTVEHSLPTTLNISVPGLSSKTMLDVFDAAGLRVSAGSACSAAKAIPSYVLDAMGLPGWRTESAVRLSIGPLVDAPFIQAAVDAIARCGAVLQAMAEAGRNADNESRQATAAATLGNDEDAAAFTLQWRELDGFLLANPSARLVDVREESEHLASQGVRQGAWVASSVPLSRLEAYPDGWSGSDEVPVVLVCRSGNRSLKAARWLRSLGHLNVRHVHGGLALRDVAP
jgi:cysteine desulfurase